MKQRICLVEDEESLSEMIRLNLELEGYEVTLFSNGRRASESIKSDSDYDLFILDVMLPGMDGISLCEQIREIGDQPVLFLSAKGTTADRIEGLKAGGNDYLPKPFDLEELLLRVNVLIKTVVRSVSDSIQIGECIINLKSYVVKKPNGETVELSKKETDLIRLFAEKEGEVVSRSEILDNVWGADQYPTTRTIDNFILNLRKIFETNPKVPKHFHSVRGVGYKFTK